LTSFSLLSSGYRACGQFNLKILFAVAAEHTDNWTRRIFSSAHRGYGSSC